MHPLEGSSVRNRARFRRAWPLMVLFASACGSNTETSNIARIPTAAPIPADAAWSRPVKIATAPICEDAYPGPHHDNYAPRSMYPHLGMNVGGQALALWSQCDAAGKSGGTGYPYPFIPSSAWASPLKQGAWAAPLRLGSGTTGDVALGAAGSGVALFSSSTEGDRDGVNQYATSDLNGGWSAFRPLGVPGSVSLHGNAAGQIVAMSKNSVSDDAIYASAFGAKGWTPAVHVAANQGGRVAFGVDGEGTALALWAVYKMECNTCIYCGETCSNEDLWSASFTAATGWSAPTKLQNANGGDHGAVLDVYDISVNRQGNAVAVWGSSDGQIWAARYSRIGGWREPFLVATFSMEPRSIHTAIDEAGNALLLTDGDINDVQAGRLRADGGIEPLQHLNHGKIPGEFHLLSDAAGNGVAVWPVYDSDWSAVLVSSRYIVGTGWSPSAEVTSAFDLGMDLALDPTGRAILLWGQRAGEQEDVWVRALGNE